MKKTILLSLIFLAPTLHASNKAAVIVAIAKNLAAKVPSVSMRPLKYRTSIVFGAGFATGASAAYALLRQKNQMPSQGPKPVRFDGIVNGGL